ncbi:MAG: N5-carboxyaminoimidazole ribonucleotide mutase, partial [uncultured Acidimicrobiales bacterium]
ESRRTDGVAQRPVEDGPGHCDPHRVRGRGRRAGHVGPPHASSGGRVRRHRQGERVRRHHLRRRDGRPPRRGGGGQHHPPCDRRTAVGWGAERCRRPLRHRPDAARHPGGHRCHRRSDERRSAGRADAGHHRRRPRQTARRETRV